MQQESVSKWKARLRVMSAAALQAELEKYAGDKRRFPVVNGIMSQRFARGEVAREAKTLRRFNIPDKLWSRVNRAASVEKISIAEFIRQALENECRYYEGEES